MNSHITTINHTLKNTQAFSLGSSGQRHPHACRHKVGRARFKLLVLALHVLELALIDFALLLLFLDLHNQEV